MTGRSKWQPIETAPKDGTVVLVYANSDPWNGMWVARWDDEDGYVVGWIHAAREQNLGSYVSKEPTHWMPLPDPPSTKGVKQEELNPDAYASWTWNTKTNEVTPEFPPQAETDDDKSNGQN